MARRRKSRDDDRLRAALALDLRPFQYTPAAQRVFGITPAHGTHFGMQGCPGGIDVNPTPRPIFVFQCSGNTYMECIERSLFGSNDPWPLQVKDGDFGLLHHYEYDSLFGLWRARGDGGKRLQGKAWGGKFPFQGSVGSAERVLEGPRAEQVLQLVRTLTTVSGA